LAREKGTELDVVSQWSTGKVYGKPAGIMDGELKPKISEL